MIIETTERVKQQERLDKKIDAETDARVAEDAKLDQKVKDESAARVTADDKLAGMDIASGKMNGNHGKRSCCSAPFYIYI